jgi:hypothetical protein
MWGRRSPRPQEKRAKLKLLRSEEEFSRGGSDGDAAFVAPWRRVLAGRGASVCGREEAEGSEPPGLGCGTT